MFKCLDWPCPATFIFCFSRRQSWQFGLLAPQARAVATRVSGRKWVQSTGLDIVNASFCNLSALALGLALHIFATQCWRVPRRAKQLSTAAILLYRFLSCWCLKTFSRSISLAVYCGYKCFWLARSLADLTLAALIAHVSLQLVTRTEKHRMA